MAMTPEERKLRGRIYWSVRKTRMNALKRAKYFRETLPVRTARQREKEIESEVLSANPKQKFNSKSDSEKRTFVQQVKAGPCLDCGGKFHAWAMEFDHRVPALKAFSLAQIGHKGSFSLKRIQEEIEKCDLVCANCHRARTARRAEGLPATLPPPEYHI